MRPKPAIALASSIMTDIIGSAEDLKQDWPEFDPGTRYDLSDFPAGFRTSFGGVGPNIAYNLAMLGLRATLLGQTGKDFDAPPRSYKRWLQGYRIDVSRIKIHPNEPGSYVVITTDKNGAQSFYPSYCRFDLDYCAIVRDIKPDILVISTDNGTAASMEYVAAATERGIPYIFDPGQNVEYFSIPEMIEAVTGAQIVICNEKEYEIIKERTGFWLWQTPTLIITKGSRGVELRKRKRLIQVGPVETKVAIDPTGAGDAFRAGLLYGLAKNWPLEQTLMLANTVAVFAVESVGAQNHQFTKAGIKKRCRENYGEELPL